MRNYFPDPTGYADYLRRQPEYNDRVKEFAVRLHDKLCRLSHMDQCHWQYEGDCWSEYTHTKYFNKAKELMSSGVPQDAIIDIIDVANRW